MIVSFFTKEQHWQDKWDVFLQETDRGIYNQLSDWIKAYQVYGFDYVFYIITDNDKIVGGCGLVVAKFSFFKFLIAPCGPVLLQDYESLLDNSIKDFLDYAKKQHCCCFQINIPLIKENNNYNNTGLNHVASTSLFYEGIEGTKFKYVIPLYGMRIIDLDGKTIEDVILKYSSNHKRKLKKSAEFNLEFKFVSAEHEIQEAYQCFVQNAKQKGYPLRSYDAVKDTLKSYIEKDFAKIAVCYFENRIVGAIYVMKCGKRFIYLNGGVLEAYQHLPISIYLHHEIIKYSISLDYKCYDISVGGSSGVVRFKEGFGSDLYNFENTRHWILSSYKFSMYLFVERKLKRHKQKIGGILFYLKKFFK